MGLNKEFLRCVVFVCTLYCGCAFPAELTAPGRLVFLENGWNGEGVAISHSTASVAGCATETNSFAIDKNHPAYKELVAIALSAYTSESNVELIVDKGVCGFGGRTKVISIRLKK
ncbi:hypothetical protein [Xanthomonas arboricola]|uniref:hypothetical protein n=1 Tax=Xanthomonas arboricola TaxID=56448 RepID=UPI0011B0E8DC|nr:hypothetical protein [Xanthomonas arboricola]